MAPPPPPAFDLPPPPEAGGGGVPNKTIFGMPGISHLDAESLKAEQTAPTIDLESVGPELELDLPAPASSPAQGDLDLPAPVDVDLDLPAPAGSPSADVDLPAPVDLDVDLPTPAGAPADGVLDLPAPANLDLPAPVDLDLPAPANLDLPAPVDLDLPAPAGLDLPAPAGLDLPEPKDLQLPGPKGADTPSVDELDLDLGDALPPAAEPRTMIPDTAPSASPANLVTAVDTDSPDLAARPGYAIPSPDRTAAMRSPAPARGRGAPRGLLIGGGLLIAVAGAGAGLYFGGLIPTGDSQITPGPNPELDLGGETPRAPEAPAEERSAKVLEKLATDTAKGYQDAMKIAEALNDKVGRAEAVLLTHLRYGPDPVLAGQANALLEPFAKQTEEFVVRVVGLLALASGDLEGAEAALTGEQSRTRLYRGWLRLKQKRAADALADADAVLAAEPDDVGALHLQVTAKLDSGAADAVAALEKAATDHPEHPLLQQLLVEHLLINGRLKEARERSAQLDGVAAASKAHQAHVLGLRGRVAMAVGERSEAVLRFDQALELAPGNVDVALDRIRVLLRAREFSTVRSGLEVLRREHPDLVAASLLDVELALSTGKGPKALEILATLQGKDEANPQIPFLLGQVHAMRMAVDDARAAFDKTRSLDKFFYRASMAEAQMLAKAGRLDQALDLLADAKAAMAEAPNSVLAQSELMLTRAQLQAAAENVDAAVAELDAALTIHPTNNDARLLRGTLHVQAGRTDKGAEDLIAVYEQTGGYPGLSGPLGRIFMRQGKIEEVEKLLGKQVDDARAANDIVLLAAQLRLAQNNLEAAKTLVDRVLAQDSGSWEAHLIKAQVHVGEGDYESALVEIQQARPRKPQAELELWRGKILEYNGNPDKALPHYAKVIDLAPELTEAGFLHGRLLAYKGAAKAAIAELEPVVKKTDEYPSAWMALGLAYRDLNKYDQAVGAFRKAAKLDPKLAEARYYEGRLHNDRNKHAQTITALNAATTNATGNEQWLPQAYRMLGRAQMSSNNKAGARKSFEKYLQIATPNAAGAKEVRRLMRDL